MRSMYRLNQHISLLIVLLVTLSPVSLAQKKEDKENKKGFRTGQPVLWRDPGDIRLRNLRYGPGSARLAPVPPFSFLKEDKSGVSPKFEIRDARGVKWVVKLGEEAQSETVATRLVWAPGYFAEEAYYFPRVRIATCLAFPVAESLSKLDRLYAAHGSSRGEATSSGVRGGIGSRTRLPGRAS